MGSGLKAMRDDTHHGSFISLFIKSRIEARKSVTFQVNLYSS
jgi:hypothetical protein